MINSLRKDSHITQPLRHSQVLTNSGSSASESKSERREYCTAPAKNSIGISVRKPAEISFSGLSSAKIANEKNFKTIIEAARNIVGNSSNKKLQNKGIQTLVKDAVEFISSGKKNPEGNLKTFLNSNNSNLNDIIKKTRELVKDANKKDPLSPEKFEEEVKKTINSAVEVFPALEKPSKFFKNEQFKNFLEMADNNHAVFGSIFALVLTGLFRPAAIMALPGEKKNIDDKKYAAAHSVASGLIAYSLSLLISSPLAKAMEKIEKNPEKLLKGDKLEYLTHTRAFNAARRYVNILHEAILAPPRAMITIALIPLILKYLFGLEKKKHGGNDKNIQHTHNHDAVKTDEVKVEEPVTQPSVAEGTK